MPNVIEIRTRSRWLLGVYQWDPTVRFLLKHYFGYNIPPPTTWDGIEEAVKPEHWKWIWSPEGGAAHGMFRHGHVYTGAIEAIRELDSLVDIVIITARPQWARNDTLEWLAFNRIPTQEIHIMKKGVPKSTIGCDMYLDDSLANIKDLALNTKGYVMLMDRPWNQPGSDKNVYHQERIYSWPAVVDAVKERIKHG